MGFCKTRAHIGGYFLAIYSLHHSSIGKATQDKAYTSSAHLRYITRDKACREVLSERMPTDPLKAQRWMREQEKAGRKNERVCDKVMLALPRELDAEQRAELIQNFAEQVTQGKAPWFAAIHDKGKDKQNPHCHLVIRDRDPNTGKRCLYLSAGKKEAAQLAKKGIKPVNTIAMREAWESHANAQLELAGIDERIDRRTLKEQGIDRQPTLHEGVQARQMTARGERPHSKVVEFTNSPTARSDRRTVDYAAIDKGNTRQEYNAQIIELDKHRKKELPMSAEDKKFLEASATKKELVADYKQMAKDAAEADKLWLDQQLKLRQQKEVSREKELEQKRQRGFGLGD